MKRKLLAFLGCFVLVFCFAGCERDYERTTYQKDLDLAVEAEPNSIADLEEEMTKIAHEYDENGLLTEAMAVFSGDEDIANEKGTLSFTYCSYNEETKRSTTVILTYDMYDKKVTKVNYDQGLAKLSEELTKPIWEDGKKIPFSFIFEKVREEDDFKNKIGGENITLTVEFTSANVETSLI
ncbi:hypothetical protein [Massiliimalia timonensis]|uniref:hypothetical protein n=1 Tax=Massiliimalia timonensis TaxID=1987501 RepID=UPI000B8AC02C|nr:hypothetical protein [Massiliimalia timonensis]MBS7174610.1 hypothetical protein [Clostridiales bacterium]